MVSTESPPKRRMLELVYQRGVENFDRALGVLLRGLEAEPDHDQAVLIIASDHGESLFERGFVGHGMSLYDEEQAIPFAARMPGVSSESDVTCPMGLVDVMATLCEYLAATCPDRQSGTSFLSRDGSPGRRSLVPSEGVVGHPKLRSIRNLDYKLIRGSHAGASDDPFAGYKLFAISSDAAEQVNLLEAGRRTSEIEDVFAVLDAELDRAIPAVTAPAPLRREIDTDTEEHLRALGYLGER